MQLQYDEDVLELVSVTDHELLPDGVFGQTKTSPFALQWDGGDLNSNITANGNLATLTFKIADDAELGDTALTLSVTHGVINAALNPVAATCVNGAVTVVDPVPTSRIEKQSVSLSSDISVRYLATLHDEHLGAQMRFTMNGKETVVDGVSAGSGNMYVYTFRGLAPQCMGDNIVAELILNGEVLATRETSSVLEYCNQLLNASAAQLGISESKYAAMRTAVADILEYGAQAQIYRNYKTDSLVNAGITGQTTFQTLTSTHKQVGTSSMTGVAFKGVGLYFDYVNSLYVSFEATNMTQDNFYVLYTNTRTNASVKYTLANCTYSNNKYNLTMAPINATYFDDCYKIELYVKNAGGTFVPVQTLNYSVKSYIYDIQNQTNNGELTTMAKLARATYNYGLSATAYAAA